MSQIKIIPVNDFPSIYESDRGASYIVDLLFDLAKVIDGDIIVIAQKIISKIECIDALKNIFEQILMGFLIFWKHQGLIK